MPSTALIRRALGPLVAGVALAGGLAASTAGLAQQVSPADSDPLLRGTTDAVVAAAAPSAIADQFRSTPAASFDSTGLATAPATDPDERPIFDPDRDPNAPPAAAVPRRADLPAITSLPDRRPGIANAIKPVKPIKQYGPKKTTIRHQLPPLQPYRTAIRPRGNGLREAVGPIEPLRGTVDAADTTLPPPGPGPTVAALPLPLPRRRPIVEANPYAPVGIGIGSLRVTPYVETDIGYDSNPDQTTRAFAKPSGFARVEGGGTVQSDWSRHELKADLRAGYYDYFQDREANRPDANGIVNGRIDVTRDTTIDTVARFTVATQRPGSPEIALGQAANNVNGRPLQYTYGGEGGVTHKFGRLSVSLRGTIDRFGYEDATFSNGIIFPLSRDNYVAYGAKARLSYELTPGVSPFAEGFGSVRRYDHTLDSSGTNRNSTGEGARVGSTFELTRLLTGEASVGYENRDYISRTLRPLRAPLVDASLVYSATPLTTVTLKATNELDETNILNSSGSVARRVSLEVSHALLRNVTLTGLLAYQNVDYQGIKLTENTYDIGLKVDYNLSRSVVIRGSFTHERLNSGTPGLDYTQNVFLLGLRLQR